ncbi:hypothetical protein DICPUDRAFT_80347 [Dictyostelium purpureum]|uniref:Uncharacterized protein n=1 Tax=Dictyostelium purpureum TaxID=5786 RepID=F0ZQ83_DICPU|nr:uncharacterized protein DICPUDRAFT_80347 [Dictyostelium purpureum]EGC33898.1 hypothetical protein DICPUDRAFT_80347 [Dictyostelium purpureum]|eukprot:XP_003289581.1 hypothetical protein DICPUDRAFT_80347 [Dictyostelium purpureum]
MGIFFKKNNTIENFLTMDSKISKMQSKIKASKDFHYGIYSKVIFFSIIIEIFLLSISYAKSLSCNTLVDNALCYVNSVVFSIIIYITIKLYRFLFRTLIKYYKNQLGELNFSLEKLLDDKKLQSDFDNIKKVMEKYERAIKKKENNNRVTHEHQPQQPQPEQLQKTPQPEKPEHPQYEQPQILNQRVHKNILSEEINTILGELKVIDSNLSNFKFLRSLETHQLDFLIINVVNCAVYFDNVSDDVKTISSLIVSKVFSQAYFDPNIPKEYIDKIELAIEKLYLIIANCKKHRHYQIEGAVSVFKDLAISLYKNKSNGKINDMVIIDMVWCSTLDLFEEFGSYLEVYNQLHYEIYYIICNYFHFTSDSIRSEHFKRFMDISKLRG